MLRRNSNLSEEESPPERGSGVRTYLHHGVPVSVSARRPFLAYAQPGFSLKLLACRTTTVLPKKKAGVIVLRHRGNAAPMTVIVPQG